MTEIEKIKERYNTLYPSHIPEIERECRKRAKYAFINYIMQKGIVVPEGYKNAIKEFLKLYDK